MSAAAPTATCGSSTDHSRATPTLPLPSSLPLLGAWMTSSLRLLLMVLLLLLLILLLLLMEHDCSCTTAAAAALLQQAAAPS